jgi:hypothetical protein
VHACQNRMVGARVSRPLQLFLQHHASVLTGTCAPGSVPPFVAASRTAASGTVRGCLRYSSWLPPARLPPAQPSAGIPVLRTRKWLRRGQNVTLCEMPCSLGWGCLEGVNQELRTGGPDGRRPQLSTCEPAACELALLASDWEARWPTR